MTNYQEIIQKNIKEFDEFWQLDAPDETTSINANIKQWHTQSLISYLEEENKRLEESKKKGREVSAPCPDADPNSMISCAVYHFKIVLSEEDKGYNQAINEQVEHNKNVIAYMKGL